MGKTDKAAKIKSSKNTKNSVEVVEKTKSKSKGAAVKKQEKNVKKTKEVVESEESSDEEEKSSDAMSEDSDKDKDSSSASDGEDSSSESENSSSGEEESEEEEGGQMQVDDKSESSSDEENDEEEEADSDDNNDEDEDEEEESSDEEEDDKAEAGTKRKATEDEDIPTPKQQKFNNELSVFVGQINFDASADDVRSHFEECGEIKDVRMSINRETGKHKGFGHIEFATEEGVKAALDLHGSELMNFKLNVTKAGDKPDHKKDRFSTKSNKVFVASLSYDVDEETLRKEFEPYGSIAENGIRIPTDRESGKLKGFAYVEYSTTEEAEKAVNAMNGKKILGRPIRTDFDGGSGGGRGGFQGNRGGRGDFRGGRGGRGDFRGGRGGRGDFRGGRSDFRGGRGGRGGFRGGRGGFNN